MNSKPFVVPMVRSIIVKRQTMCRSFIIRVTLIVMIGLVLASCLLVVTPSAVTRHAFEVFHATSPMLPADHVWVLGKRGSIPWVGISADSSCTVIGFPRRYTYIAIPFTPWQIMLVPVVCLLGVAFIMAPARRLHHDSA